MTTPPTPVPVPEPQPPLTPAPSGMLAHLEQWIATHFAPDVARARADAARALEYAAAHAAQEEAVASLLVKILSVADPAAAPLLAALLPEAERLLADAGKWAPHPAGTVTVTVTPPAAG